MTPGTYAPFATTDAFFIGQHNIFERNGIVLNDLALLETYVVEEVVGFERPDGALSAEVNTSSHGENPNATFWGGRTVTLSGYIRAGTYTTAMKMGEALRVSLATRQEMPLKIDTPPGSVLTHETYILNCQPADFMIDPKAQPSDIRGQFKRAFSVSLRASYPFYERNTITRADYNWAGQPRFQNYQSYSPSAGMNTVVNGPGTIPGVSILAGELGYRVSVNPSTVADRIAGPVTYGSENWMPVYPGDALTGSVWATTVGGPADQQAYPSIAWRRADGTIISYATAGYTAFAGNVTGNMVVTGIAPAQAAYASVTATVRRTSTGPSDIWFTRAWLGLTSAWTTYGTYTDGDDPGWEWVGEPDKSFSRADGSTTFSLVPTTVSIPGRPYDRVYDLAYDELMDQDGNLVTTGPNVIDVLTSGTGDARMIIHMTGYMSGITLVNETTSQAMWFTDIAPGNAVTVDTYTGEVFDQNGVARSSLIDARSDFIYIAGKRDGRTGTNRLVLYVEDFDASAKFSISFRKTHF